MAAAIKGADLAARLGKDEFLKLLLTKMKYQDPLNPRADEEFLAQLAHFTAMEQMIQLNTAFEKFTKTFTETSCNQAQYAALNLLGTRVKANELDKDGKPIPGKTIEGLVTKITSKDGVPKMIISTGTKEWLVGMEHILEVSLY